MAVAERTLAPLGARVVAGPGPDRDLPFPDASFDLVTSRHPVSVRWDEVARVLKPGGSYFSQDVGHPSVGELTEFMMGPAPATPEPDQPNRDPKWSVLAAERAGLTVAGLREFHGRMEFNDVAAVVVFLRKVIWIVPGFTMPATATGCARCTSRSSGTGRSWPPPSVSSSRRASYPSGAQVIQGARLIQGARRLSTGGGQRIFPPGSRVIAA